MEEARHAREERYGCAPNQNNTHTGELNPGEISFRWWFGRLGNSLIVFRLKRCPELPEAGGY